MSTIRYNYNKNAVLSTCVKARHDGFYAVVGPCGSVGEIEDMVILYAEWLEHGWVTYDGDPIVAAKPSGARKALEIEVADGAYWFTSGPYDSEKQAESGVILRSSWILWDRTCA